MSDHILIRDGEVFDGGGGAGGGRGADVRIRGGRIAEIGRRLDSGDAEVIDATGLLVTPGLVDLHVHVFTGVGVFPVEPADAGLRHGVTAMLDTGTAGALTYPAFHRYVMPAAREYVFALLNISMIGCVSRHDVPPFVSDLLDARYCQVGPAVDCIEAHRDRILGTKARLTAAIADHRPENERAGLEGALEAAERTGLPCMLHHVLSAIPVEEVLEAMRPGDIYTHSYHPHGNGPFSGGAAGFALARRARERGVVFDVGHGMGSFDWATAERACLGEGMWPDTISTDVHAFNIRGPVFDLPTTMSKFLHLGMPLERVIHATTAAPADAMRLADRLGRLLPGREADVALLRLEEGRFELSDVSGQVRTATRRLRAVGAFRSGQRVASPANPGPGEGRAAV